MLLARFVQARLIGKFGKEAILKHDMGMCSTLVGSLRRLAKDKHFNLLIQNASDAVISYITLTLGWTVKAVHLGPELTCIDKE